MTLHRWVPSQSVAERLYISLAPTAPVSCVSPSIGSRALTKTRTGIRQKIAVFRPKNGLDEIVCPPASQLSVKIDAGHGMSGIQVSNVVEGVRTDVVQWVVTIF